LCNFIILICKPCECTLRMKQFNHARCTIAVNSTTRDLMKKVAKKEQTYDDLINELLIEAKNTESNLS